MGATEGCWGGIYSAFLLLMTLTKRILSAPLLLLSSLLLMAQWTCSVFAWSRATMLLEGEESLRKIEEVNLIMPVGIWQMGEKLKWGCRAAQVLASGLGWLVMPDLTWGVQRRSSWDQISFRHSWISRWRHPTGNDSEGAQDEVRYHLLWYLKSGHTAPLTVKTDLLTTVKLT